MLTHFLFNQNILFNGHLLFLGHLLQKVVYNDNKLLSTVISTVGIWSELQYNLNYLI